MRLSISKVIRRSKYVAHVVLSDGVEVFLDNTPDIAPGYDLGVEVASPPDRVGIRLREPTDSPPVFLDSPDLY